MATEPVSPADTIRQRVDAAEADGWYAYGEEAIADVRALLAVGERDRQHIAQLTAAYCDPKMWRETWLDNGASVWEFLCAADCDEPWNPIAVLAGEEDAANG